MLLTNVLTQRKLILILIKRQLKEMLKRIVLSDLFDWFFYSLIVGIYDVMHDNRTEHLRTINILERFNIYQEVILAALYRILPIQVYLRFLFPACIIYCND